MKRIDGIQEVQEVYGIIDVGTTEPVKCRLANQMNVVVKYKHNRFGPAVLINEMVGSSVGDLIDLTIPEYGICNLSAEVIADSEENEELDSRNAGLAFFSKEYSCTIPPVPKVLSKLKNVHIEQLILFDYIVNNCDRHIGNLLINMSESGGLYYIDNSHIIGDSFGEISEREMEKEYIVSPNILLKNHEVYDLLYTSIPCTAKEIIETAEIYKSIITDNNLFRIKSTIPSEWIVHYEDYYDKSFDIIKRRVYYIEDIAMMIIKERGMK